MEEAAADGDCACHADELFNLGNKLDEEGRYEDAAEAYQRSVSISEASSGDWAALIASIILPGTHTVRILAKVRFRATCCCSLSEPIRVQNLPFLYFGSCKSRSFLAFELRNLGFALRSLGELGQARAAWRRALRSALEALAASAGFE